MNKFKLIPIKSVLIILAVFLLGEQNSFGQNPGYKGRYFAFSYGISGMPVTGTFIGEKKFDFNARHSLRLETILAPNFSIGILYEKTWDQVYLENYSTSKLSPLDELTFGNLGSTPKSFQSAAYWDNNSIGAFMRLYHKKSFGSIAPVGTYWQLQVLFNDVTVHDDGRYYNSGRKEIHSFQTSTYVFGKGIQYILYSYISLDLSLNFGFNIHGYSAFAEQFELENYNTNIEDIFNLTESKMFTNYIVYFGVNIGYLPF